MVQYSWIFLYHGEILELEWLPQIRGIKKKHLTEVKIPQIWGKIIWGRINRVWSPSLDDWLMVYWTWSDQLICTVKSSSHIDVDVQISGFEQVRACLFISTGKLQSVVKLFVIFLNDMDSNKIVQVFSVVYRPAHAQWKRSDQLSLLKTGLDYLPAYYTEKS